ncbi:MAG: hypothetical protein H0U35_03675 [Sporichthyaceae bacterium]|nr:hypothetical protein [Sporichthyaceae bacterium]
MPIHRLVGARPRPRPFQVLTTRYSWNDLAPALDDGGPGAELRNGIAQLLVRSG